MGFFKSYSYEKLNEDFLRKSIWYDNLEEVLSKLNNLEIRLKTLEIENIKLKRIIENSVENKITYKNDSSGHASWGIYYKDKEWSYIYRDSKEYKIESLSLFKPTFEQGDSDNILFVTDIVSNEDGEVEKKYVLDLSDCSFIQTK